MQRSPKEATIGVRGESYDTVHAYILDPPNDIPEGYEPKLQNWATDQFATALDPGETHDRIGTMEYYPNDEVVDFHRR